MFLWGRALLRSGLVGGQPRADWRFFQTRAIHGPPIERAIQERCAAATGLGAQSSRFWSDRLSRLSLFKIDAFEALGDPWVKVAPS
jgi:hypothetical protein